MHIIENPELLHFIREHGTVVAKTNMGLYFILQKDLFDFDAFILAWQQYGEEILASVSCSPFALLEQFAQFLYQVHEKPRPSFPYWDMSKIGRGTISVSE